MRIEEISPRSYLKCPVCGKLIGGKRKPRTNDLALHIFLKSEVDAEHRKWIEKYVGKSESDVFSLLRDYLKKVDYVETEKVYGFSVFVPKIE
jgi:hypothetical protein